MAIIEIILPVFGIVLIGYVAGRSKFFKASDIEGVSKFVFNIAIPVMLFRTMATVELPDQIEWGYLASYYIGAFAVYGFGMITGRTAFSQHLGEQGVFGLGAAYSNLVLLGIPLVLLTFGEEGTVPMFMLLAFHSALMFLTVSAIGEFNRGRGQSIGSLLQATFLGLAKNPIVGGLMLGLLFNLMKWTIPDPIDQIIGTLGAAGVPGAVFSLGASLSLYRLAGHLPETLTLVGLKLLIHPILVYLLATFVFQVDPLWTSVAVLVAALPVGVNVYLFAQRYNACIAPVATSILLSTALSVVTISVLLMLLNIA